MGYGGSARGLVVKLIHRWAEAVHRFDLTSSAGHQHIFRDWQAQALYLNEEISVRLDQETRIEGQFIGLDETTGALKLRMKNGELRSVMAGDVMLAETS